MKQKLVSRRRRRKRNLWIACVAATAVALILALGAYYVRDSVKIGDHVPADCAIMLSLNGLQNRWATVTKLPQWSYAVKNYGDDFPWLTSADKISDVKEWFLMNFIGQEVRVVVRGNEGSPGSAKTTLLYLKISRVGKFADLIARLIRRVKVESDQGIRIRRIESGGPFYYTVLGRVLIGARTRDGVIAAATLSQSARLGEPASFGRMKGNGEVPWVTLYCNLDRTFTSKGKSPVTACYAVASLGQDGVQGRFEAPFSPEFRERMQAFTVKFQPRTSRTTTRLPADIVASLTECGSAPVAEILQSASDVFGVPKLRPDQWTKLFEGNKATLPAVCTSVFAEVVRQFGNEATLALTNVDVYEMVPTPEFLLFGEATPGAEKKFLDKIAQTVREASGGQVPLQRKVLKGVEMVYLDLPEGRSLQLCMAEIGGMLAATTSEYALDSFVDAVLGNKPSLKTTEPRLVKPEQGANLVLVVNVHRLTEVSKELFDLLLDYDLTFGMNRDKYDRELAPRIGLVELVRSVGLSAFVNKDSLTGEFTASFSKVS